MCVRQSVLFVSAGATLPRVLGAVNLSNVDFKGRDLSNHDLSGANLSGANLTGYLIHSFLQYSRMVFRVFSSAARNHQDHHSRLNTPTSTLTSLYSMLMIQQASLYRQRS